MANSRVYRDRWFLITGDIGVRFWFVLPDPPSVFICVDLWLLSSPVRAPKQKGSRPKPVFTLVACPNCVEVSTAVVFRRLASRQGPATDRVITLPDGKVLSEEFPEAQANTIRLFANHHLQATARCARQPDCLR